MNAFEKGYDVYVKMGTLDENPFDFLLEYKEWVEWVSGWRKAMLDEDLAIFGSE